jgi:hypothetical protein
MPAFGLWLGSSRNVARADYNRTAALVPRYIFVLRGASEIVFRENLVDISRLAALFLPVGLFIIRSLAGAWLAAR